VTVGPPLRPHPNRRPPQFGWEEHELVCAWALTLIAVSVRPPHCTAAALRSLPSARLSPPALLPMFSCATCRAPIAQSDAAAVPVNFDLIASLQAAEGAAAHVAALRLQVEAAHAAHRQTAAPCAECDQTATLFCEHCDGEFCSAHSRQVHSLKMFQSHNVMRVAEKAAFLAEKLRRDARGKAQKNENQCALHPDQLLYLYCTDCSAAICTVCAHGKHHSHARLEIDEAAAKARNLFESQIAQMTGGGAKSGGGSGSANGIGGGGSVGTLADAEGLGRQLREMKQGPRTAQRAACSGGNGALSTVAAFATVMLSDSQYLLFSFCFPFCPQASCRRRLWRVAAWSRWAPS